MWRALSPNNYVYLLVHLVLFVLGWWGWDSESVLWKSIGASLIATGVTGWMLFLYVKASETTAKRLEVLAETGIVEAFSRRGAVIRDHYDKRLAGARQRIDIMGFGLRALREDYLREFATWKTKARVRVLLLDPAYPDVSASFATHRDREEGNSAGDIRKEVEKFIADTKHLVDDITVAETAPRRRRASSI